MNSDLVSQHFIESETQYYQTHTRQPSLFSRESPSLEGSLLISPFLPISSLFWISLLTWWKLAKSDDFTLTIPF